MPVVDFEQRYRLQQLELKAVLEITEAINNNVSEEDLYRIFYFTLRGSLHISKFTLLVHKDDQWVCQVQHGTKHSFEKMGAHPSLFELAKPTTTEQLHPQLQEFDWVFPIRHKDRTLAYLLVSNKTHEEGATLSRQDRLDFVQALSNIILVAIENKKLVRRQLQEEALRRELELARGVQRFLLPDNLPQTSQLKVAATYIPHHRIGGDYYDFLRIDECRYLICIADVSGKGMPAAILMSNFQASLRTLIRQKAPLETMVRQLNEQIYESAKGDNFITAFFGYYDEAAATLTYVNAGHPPPMLFRKDECQLLEQGTMLLGVLPKLPFLNMETLEDLQEFLFFCYTDGVSETFSPQEEQFGMERIQEVVARHRSTRLEELHRNVIAELDGFKGNNEYGDDITMLSCYVSQS
ncbi:PP2C family protein-serine/threonine phosphatase [Cesiribacter andamanensis]|uniref:Phosphoserine phosphatase rsbU n=1 Tax=Cesiribacter andamanensis AMV16 TaxID=1279009 RepID=M7NQY1_9BACT|nr:PP2C family protein-serine/threonine phosphatase [Cesiribacter andamanensis]EMR00909.1 Phosphoserine phosphatase rsbU [Cesiribacter andamanensis AMV16]